MAKAEHTDRTAREPRSRLEAKFHARTAIRIAMSDRPLSVLRCPPDPVENIGYQRRVI